MKLNAVDIGRSASAADVIQKALREAIVFGEIADGEVLRQDTIARQFNVSRIPVREALARLEMQGLVTSHRYKGAVVASLSLDEIAETFEFRALVEPEIIRHSVRRLTSASLAEARIHCEAFATESAVERWAPLNRAFHYALYRDSGRPYHLRVVSDALDQIGRYLRAQLVLTDGMATARVEHRAILDACAAGEADRAADLTREHILGASGSLIAFLRAERAATR